MKRLPEVVMAGICFVAVLLLPGLSFASAPVGDVVSLKGIVSVQPGEGEAYFLDKDSSIYEGDTITSAKKSFVVVNFIDESKIVIRQDTIFVVEGYSYGEGKNESALKLIKGGIRAVTGAIARENPDNYKLETDVASLGVRGTAYDARVCDEKCLAESSGKQSKAADVESECRINLSFDKPKTGVYFTVRDGEVIITKGTEVLNLQAGDVAFADDQQFGCLPQMPSFLQDLSIPLPESDDFRDFSLLQCS